MNVFVDLNVILDILQKRDPHFVDSYQALEILEQEGYPDFEDGIVAEEAHLESCEVILTRNSQDFSSSLVPAITPTEFLTRFFNR